MNDEEIIEEVETPVNLENEENDIQNREDAGTLSDQDDVDNVVDDPITETTEEITEYNTEESVEETTEETTEETMEETVEYSSSEISLYNVMYETYEEIPFLEKPLNEYNTAEGLLFCTFVISAIILVVLLFKD